MSVYYTFAIIGVCVNSYYQVKMALYSSVLFNQGVVMWTTTYET